MISRRELIAAAPAALAAQQTTQRSGGGRAPNIIVIVVDDLGCTDLGCYGAADLRTPHLDAMAAQGVRWTSWYSNAPVCAPARGSIVTGRYPQHNGLTQNGKVLGPEQKTLATLLKPAGYATAAIGKWHLGSTPETRPNAHGFDYFYGFLSGCVDFYSHRYYWGEPRMVNYHDLWRNGTEIWEDGQYLTGRITEETVDFIGKNRARPFFAYVAYNAPHYPMHAPEKYMARFQNLPLERRTYAAMIAAVDDGVGEIRSTLQRLGLLDNTLIVFVGDNGATTERRAGLNGEYATAGSNGPFRGFKFSLFDGGMHVPAIVSWPARLPKGRVESAVAMSMDIVPTALAAAGTRPPDGYKLDGASVLEAAGGRGTLPPRFIAWSSGGQEAIRRGDWKLTLKGKVFDRTPAGNQPLQGDDEVFLANLVKDPGETTNLRRQHPQIVDELSTALASWRNQYSE